jgi:hypothetical protein
VARPRLPCGHGTFFEVESHHMKNRRLVFLAAAIVAAVLGLGVARPGSARAEDIGVTRKVGLGLTAGVAPGFSAKAWVSPRNALDLGLGIGLGDFACNPRFNPCGQRMSFNLDYLVHPGRGLLDPGWLTWHVGLGARVWFYQYGQTVDTMDFALRVPIGLDLMWFDFLETFAEVAPSLGFGPTLAFVEGAIGARIYVF